MTTPIPGHTILAKALEDSDSVLLAQWLALKPDLNAEALCTPRYLWDTSEQQKTAIQSGHAMESSWPLLHQVMGDGREANLAMTRLLLQAGADPNRHVHAIGNTTLDQAVRARNNSVTLLKMLVDAGADLSVATPSGFAPIHSAAQTGNMGAAQYLESLGANVAAIISDGRSALYLAVEHPQMCEWLAQRLPGDVNRLQGVDFLPRLSPLMRACELGYIESVKVLMTHGGNPRLKSSTNEDSFEIAQSKGFPEVSDWIRAFESAVMAQSIISGAIRSAAPGKP